MCVFNRRRREFLARGLGCVMLGREEMAMVTTAQKAPSSEQCLVLYDVTWRDYLRLGRLFGGRRLRMTYDRGTLEIMTLSPRHERWKYILNRLVGVLAEELHIRTIGFGSMTCKRRKKRRGLEPDDCYWVANAAAIRGRLDIDLRVDPPPDLAIEIDVTSSSLDRMGIYRALAVVEVWRFDANTLTFSQLRPDGHYALIPTSVAFPGLSAADLMPFLTLAGEQDDQEILQAFRAWVRQRFGTSRQSP
jgi:Uma2 family endonuclease